MHVFVVLRFEGTTISEVDMAGAHYNIDDDCIRCYNILGPPATLDMCPSIHEDLKHFVDVDLPGGRETEQDDDAKAPYVSNDEEPVDIPRALRNNLFDVIAANSDIVKLVHCTLIAIDKYTSSTTILQKPSFARLKANALAFGKRISDNHLQNSQGKGAIKLCECIAILQPWTTWWESLLLGYTHRNPREGSVPNKHVSQHLSQWRSLLAVMQKVPSTSVKETASMLAAEFHAIQLQKHNSLCANEGAPRCPQRRWIHP